jgi:hypothetical protein
MSILAAVAPAALAHSSLAHPSLVHAAIAHLSATVAGLRVPLSLGEAPRCRVRISRIGPTFWHLLGSLAAMARSGQIRLDQQMMPMPPNRADGPAHLRDKQSWAIELEVDEGVRAYLDVHEGREIDEAAAARSTIYFKRCLDPSFVPAALRDKVVPYGLSMDLVGDHIDRYELSRQLHLQAGAGTRLKGLAKLMLRPARRLAGSPVSLTVADFAASPQPPAAFGPDARVLFLTRLFDPRGAMDPAAELIRADYEAMNALRIGCIRALRRELGASFLGGVAASDYARAVCPDLIVGDDVVARHNFAKLLHEYPIAVTTAGPRRSHGFKIAEYLAAARAIVAERITVQLPGPFAEKTNYLGFATPDECVAQVLALRANPAAASRQSRANWTYFHEWVEPGAHARRILETALDSALPLNAAPPSPVPANGVPLAAAPRSAAPLSAARAS